jgi:hypothetical protein
MVVIVVVFNNTAAIMLVPLLLLMLLSSPVLPFCVVTNHPHVTFALQILQGLLTPAIGLTTLYIAWQQWQGNKLTLRPTDACLSKCCRNGE